MHNLRDEKGFLKATIPDDVVWSIIHKRIVEHFTGPGNKVCLRITQDTEMSCRAGPYSSKLEVFLWAGDYLEPV
jgi:hypothetical protein